MVHPYKKFEEGRHGRAVAKARGYQSGGVVNFPVSGKAYDLQRMRSSQGVESGRIDPVERDNVQAGPGRNRITGGIKRNWINRQDDRDLMVYAKGGAIKSDIAQDKKLVKRAMHAHDTQQHGGKHTKLGFKSGGGTEMIPGAKSGRIKLTGGAESGIGRMQLAKRAARHRKQ